MVETQEGESLSTLLANESHTQYLSIAMDESLRLSEVDEAPHHAAIEALAYPTHANPTRFLVIAQQLPQTDELTVG